MTVIFHTDGPVEKGGVYYGERPGGNDPAGYPQHAQGTVTTLDLPSGTRTVCQTTIAGLEPGGSYHFIAGDPRHGYSAPRRFRTVSRAPDRLRFAAGGDMKATREARLLLSEAAKREVLFAALGGDIAYCDGNLAAYRVWEDWLRNWEECMVTPQGYTIPFIVAIGNHEVRGGYGAKPEDGPFFFTYFGLGTTSYFSRSLGNLATLFVLDSGHVAAPGGAQAEWLERALASARDVPYKFAIYHVPMYSSSLPDDDRARTLRKSWLPSFDGHGLTAAFENHAHAFKRTQPLRAGVAAVGGTLYLGDGCWGVPPFPVGEKPRAHEDKVASLRHFWLVDITREGVEYRAVHQSGQVFDVYPTTASGRAQAERVYGMLQTLSKLRIEAAPYAYGVPIATTIRGQARNFGAEPLELRVNFIEPKDAEFAPAHQTVALEAGGNAQWISGLSTRQPAVLRMCRAVVSVAREGITLDDEIEVPLGFLRRATPATLADAPLDGSWPTGLPETPAMSGFLKRRSGEPAAQTTEGWIAATPAGLYLRVHGSDAELQARAPEKETTSPMDTRPRADELVELFVFRGGAPALHQYQLTRGGDAKASSWSLDQEQASPQASAARMCATEAAGYWIAEALIPWPELGFPAAPAAGTELRLDVARTHTRLGKAEISRWCNLEKSSYEWKSFGVAGF